MKIAFICVNYNNSFITLKYISNVLSLVGKNDVKIIVVDNASEESDLNNLLSSSFIVNNPIINVIKLESNLGYFKGLNEGIVWASENSYNTYQVIGNNDLEFHFDFIENLKKLKLNSDELVIAPDVITRNGTHENPHVLTKMSFLRKLKYKIYFSSFLVARVMSFFYSTERKFKAYDPDRKHIYMGIGALYVLTPHFFKYFDKLWDGVFLYGEEAILAGQINSVNGKILYEPILKCNHIESSSTSKIKTKEKYKIIQNSYKVYRKYL